MAFTTPTTWADSTLVTAALLNVQISGNIQYLKDVLDGAQYQAVTPRTNVAGGGVHSFGDLNASPSGGAAVVLEARRLGSDSKAVTLRLINVGYSAGWDFTMPSGSTDLNLVSVGTATPLKVLPAGQFQFLNGSASAPSLAFQSDNNTGLFRQGSSLLGFAANGIEAARLSATQLLLVGATTTNVGFSWIGDPDTGFGNPAANTIDVFLGGTSLGRFDTSVNPVFMMRNLQMGADPSGGPALGGGVGVLAMVNRTTAPSSNISGGILYAQSGTLRWRGSAGNDVQIAGA